jgi:tetratricopeptide (TPR) repeat protein
LSGEFPACYRNLQEARRLGWDGAALDFEFALMTAQQAGSVTDDTRGLNQHLQSRSPEEPLVLEALATGAFRLNRLDKAFYYLNTWEEHHPNDWRPWLLRGVLHHSIGQMGPAVFDLRKALSLKPGQDEALRFLGLSLIGTGDNYQEAVDCLQSCLQANPDSSELLLALARAYRGLNQPDISRAMLKRLLAREPEHPGAWLALAQLEADSDRLPEALAALRRAETNSRSGDKLSTSEICLLANLNASLARRQGRNSEAEAYEQKLQQLKADLAELSWAIEAVMRGAGNVDSFRKIGILHLRLGMEAEGRKWLANVLRSQPNDPETHKAMAEFYERRADADARRQADRHRRRAAGEKE